MKSFKIATFCLAILSFSLLSSKANVLKNQPGDEMLENLLAYINDQEERFEIGPENEAVIIMGNERSGKTTLSLLLTDGEMDGIQETDGRYHFADQQDRITTGVPSQHRVPMLMVDDSSDTTYYDWMGFEVATGLDCNMSIKHDILPSYFIKLLAKSTKAVKFVFTVSQSTLDPTEHMGTFLEFLLRATRLIKNVDKYHDAIAMVVTKVRGQIYSKTIDSHDWHNEQLKIERVAAYLELIRKELEMRLKHCDDVHGYTPKEMENMTKFIDILLEKKDGNYQRIGIFQEPHEDVPVKYMTVQQDEKVAIRKMIDENLQFIVSHPDDFDYVVSKQIEKDEGYNKLKTYLKQ